jgi:hypothetical protein
MDKMTIPVSKEDVLQGLAGLPPDEIEQMIQALEVLLASPRLTPTYVDVKQLDSLIGLISVGGDAVADTEDIYD